MSQILVQPYLNQFELAFIIQNLFRNKALWDNRAVVKVPYRNGAWYTIGASLYLDLTHKSQLEAYGAKVSYFNKVLRNNFSVELYQLKDRIKTLYYPDQEVKFLAEDFTPAGLPGFSIMPPEETFQAEFAAVHKDERWRTLKLLPGFPFQEFTNHFSFTIPLALPIAGGGMNIDTGNSELTPYIYKVGNCYLHAGDFYHQVMEFLNPVTPLDWRITIQGHGFQVENNIYLYW